MELLALLLIALLVWLFVGPIVVITKLNSLRRRVDELEQRFSEFRRIKRHPDSETAPPSSLEPVQRPEAAAVPEQTPPPPVQVSPPPLPVTPAKPSETFPPPAAEPAKPGASGGFSWEQFVGVKLFAWIGGLALFFGIVFFVKYAFERDLVPPALRVTVGYLTAAALMAAGYWFRQRRAYIVLTQTLSSTGILAFYGVTYAAHAWYRFPAFTTAFTFVLMALITAAAFITAARAKAEVVAVLGLAGGFLTPALVASGQDQPVILFGYITLLNLGLAALAWRENWWRLLPLGAVGTVLVTWSWRLRFFESGGYAQGTATWGMVMVFGGFALLFAALATTSRQRFDNNELPWWTSVLVSASALLLAFDFLGVPDIASRPALLYTLVLLASTGWLAASWWAERFWPAAFAGSLAVTLHLSLWMTQSLTPALLPHALLINLLFGLLHLVVITRLFQRGLPIEGTAPCAIALIMMGVAGLPLLVLEEASWLLWPPLLLAAMLALFVSVLTRKSWMGLLALTLQLGFLLLWLTRCRHEDPILNEFLLVLLLSVLAFSAAPVLARRWLILDDPEETAAQHAMLRWVQLATLTLPFLLLAAIPRILSIDSPTLLLTATLALSLAAVWMSRAQSWLALSAWLGWTLVALSVEPHPHHLWDIVPWQTGVPLLAFALLWPLRRAYGESCAPLAAVGLAMGGAVWQLRAPVFMHWPEWLHWVYPALFACLWIFFTRRLQNDGAGLAQRSWSGGLALAFITVLFPYQFDHEWFTLFWALEAAALCWLFTRLPHDGLRLTGFGLAFVAFMQFLLQTWALDYTAVPLGLPMWLWLLLNFGLGGAAMLGGAHWLRPPHHRWRELPLRALLVVFGGVLLFLLLNLQIANAFMPPGSQRLVIDFGGNFARDMTYSIAWGLFALSLLLLGFWKQTPGARYTGAGLLLVTLAKLFLHDLDQVGSIYRIAAFLAVAVITLAASFVYQRAGRKLAE